MFGLSGWDIKDMLAAKYGAMTAQAQAALNQADAGMVQANAATRNSQAALLQAEGNNLMDKTRAKLLPGETAASIRKMNSDSRYTDIQADWYGKRSEAEIADLRSRAGLNNANARSTNEQTDFLGQPVFGFGYGMR